MEFSNVLANNESMAGKWEQGNPPQGDFRIAMEAIQKVLPPGVEESLSNNTYDRVFWALAQLYYTRQLTNASDEPISHKSLPVFNFSPLILLSQRVQQWWGWTELVRVEWKGMGIGSVQGFDMADGLFSDLDFVSFKDLASSDGQSQLVRSVTEALVSVGKMPRYSKTGVLGLLLDMLWWGYLCFQNNGDTIGEGDQNFFVYYCESALATYQYYLAHPEEPVSLRSRLVFEFYPQESVDLKFSVPATNLGDDSGSDAVDFPLLIDLEFIGYSKDLVGSTNYSPNRLNDAFLLATVNSKTNEKARHTLVDVGLESDELIEERIWATTIPDAQDSPLGVCSVVQDTSGKYIPSKLINSKDGEIAISLQPGAVFGLVLDLGTLTPNSIPPTHATTFNCYFKFEDMADDDALETQVVIPLV